LSTVGPRIMLTTNTSSAFVVARTSDRVRFYLLAIGDTLRRWRN
jgi:hypothetical protein